MTIERFSTNFAGNQSDGNATAAAMSSTGRYVAYVSDAHDITGGDARSGAGVYVRDTETGDVVRIDRAVDGGYVNGSAESVAISGDGRYITFTSTASNLVAGGIDDNGTTDVFVYDRVTQETKLISMGLDGTSGAGASFAPIISQNGRYISYVSRADDIRNNSGWHTEPGQGQIPDGSHAQDYNTQPGSSDLFLYDLQTGQTRIIGGIVGGPPGRYGPQSITVGDLYMVNDYGMIFGEVGIYSRWQSDGQIHFDARMPMHIGFSPDVDMQGDRWETIDGQYSVHWSGGLNNAHLSRFNIHAMGDNGPVQIKDERLELAEGGLMRAPKTLTTEMVMAENGRFVTYLSTFDYPTQSTSATLNLYIWDIDTGQVVRLADGRPGSEISNIQISANGHWITFDSDAALTADDTNGKADVFRIENPLGWNSSGGEGEFPIEEWIMGTPQEDELLGTDNSDKIDALHSNDVVAGLGGSDIIFGRAGNDWLDGGAGNDLIDGGSDSDTIVGGTNATGLETLDGGDGDDFIYGGFEDDPSTPGVDEREGAYGDNDSRDLIFGGKGFDRLWGGSGNDELWGGDNADIIRGGIGQDLIIGGANEFSPTVDPTEELFGGIGDDVIYGGFQDNLDTEEDERLGVPGDNDWADLIDGGDGDDAIFGGNGDDRLYGGDGNDDLSGGEDHDWIVAGGNDLSNPEATAFEVIIGGNGKDWIFGGYEDDIFTIADETEGLEGDSDGEDVIYGLNGDDVIRGGNGDDLIDGGDDNDYVRGGIGDDIIHGGKNGPESEEETDSASSPIDELYGGDGDDKIFGGLGDEDDPETSEVDESAGVEGDGDGQDTIYGGNGNDVAYGATGTDLIYGEDGTDKLYGGIGDDIIDGGKNADGPDVIAERLDGGDGDDWIIGGSATDKPWTEEDESEGEEGDGDGADYITGGAGDDELVGGNGDDTLEGGTDDDILHGGIGRDTLIGGRGRDTIRGGKGDDIIVDDDGIYDANSRLHLTSLSATSASLSDVGDVLDGGEGDDTIYAGAGARVTGGAGADRIVLGVDSAGMVIEDLATGAGSDAIDIGALIDAIVDNYDYETNPFATGHLRAEARDGGTVLLFDADGAAGGGGAVEIGSIAGVAPASLADVAFTAGNYDGWIDVDATRTTLVRGNERNESMKGTAANDTIDAMGGDDIVRGGTGHDELVGNDGRDTLYGEAGDDLLRSGYGNDTLDGGDGNDTLKGGQGNDTLRGGAGNDRLHIDDGADIFYGGAGNDTYFLTYADRGTDTIRDFQAGVGLGDVLDLTHTVINSFDELQARLSVDAAGNVQIMVSRDDRIDSRITLTGVKLGQLNVDDFLFAAEPEPEAQGATSSWAETAEATPDTGNDFAVYEAWSHQTGLRGYEELQHMI